ncbi:hypothetical protein HY972_01365 [Candidatus Kaiserbacteria bacterium]|nr:hypothetical protein [Candidatus Kaiserbacteria bacterium]
MKKIFRSVAFLFLLASVTAPFSAFALTGNAYCEQVQFPGSECTTDAQGRGFCDSLNICQPETSSTGGSTGSSGSGTCTTSSTYGDPCNGGSGTCSFDSFGTPVCQLLGSSSGSGSSSGGGINAPCTGSGQSTCDFGLTCTTTGEGYNTCQPPLGGVGNTGNGSGGFSGTGGGINRIWVDAYRSGIVGVVNTVLVPVLIAVAFIVFLWGVFKYFIYGADNDTERATGRQFVLWGIIGLVVIVSIWGLVNITKDTLIPAGANTNRPAYPTL